MELQAVVTALQVVIWVLAGVLFAVCVLRGIFSRTANNFFSLANALVCAPLAFLVTVLTVREGAPLVGMLEENGLGVLPAVVESAGILAALLLRPFAFLFWFCVLRLALFLVWAIVRGWILPADGYWSEKKWRIGVRLGVLTGFLVVAVTFVPLAGTAQVFCKTEAACREALADAPVSAEAEEAADGTGQVCRALEEHPLLRLFGTLDGWLYNRLTVLKTEKETYTLEEELVTCGEALGAVLPTALSDWSNTALVRTDNLEKLPEIVGQSVLLKRSVAEVLSGVSEAWLADKPFLTLEKPTLKEEEDILLRAALVGLQYSTEQTVVADLQTLCGAVQTLVSLSGAEREAISTETLTKILTGSDSILLRRVVVEAGIGLLAEQLGIPQNEEELTLSFADELAALSQEALTLSEIIDRVEALNTKYKVGMSDAECESLAALIQAFPYEESEAQSASPELAECSATGEAAFSLLTETETEPRLAWLAELGAVKGSYTTPEGNRRKLSVAAFLQEAAETGEIKLPTDCVTVERLSAMVTDEMLADLPAENLQALVQAIPLDGGDVSLAGLGALVGTMNEVSAGKPAVQSFFSELTTGVLESKTVSDALSGNQSLAAIGAAVSPEKMLGLLSSLLQMTDALKSGDATAREAGVRSLRELMENMDTEQATALTALFTAETVTGFGVRESVATPVASLLCRLVRNAEQARATMSATAYSAEADAVYTVLSVLLGTPESGEDFAAAFGVNPEELCRTIADSALLDGAFAGELTALCEAHPDDLGLQEKLRSDWREELHTAAQTVYATLPEASDGAEMLRALCLLIGYRTDTALGDVDLWK